MTDTWECDIMYTIKYRDAQRKIQGEVSDYQSLELVPRFNDVGSWILELPANTEATKFLQQPKAGIVVEKDDVSIFSGPVLTWRKPWNKDSDKLILSGKDDLHYLSGRICYPNPLGPHSGAAYDVRTGVAETIMTQYVNYNAGPGAINQRRVMGLTLAPDQGGGLNITGRARFQNLVLFLQSLALAGGDLGFRVVQSGNGIEFQIYEPEDKTSYIIFSPELGNLMAYDYNKEASKVNYTIVGGSGEGTARTIIENGLSERIVQYERFEAFIDRRDTSSWDELALASNEELAQNAETTELSISPVDTEAIQFMRDYQLGDKVTVMVDGVAIQDIVREVNIKITPEGASEVTPIIGTPGAKPKSEPKLFKQIKRLQKRISNLERR